jgi:hypothetical protein
MASIAVAIVASAGGMQTLTRQHGGGEQSDLSAQCTNSAAERSRTHHKPVLTHYSPRNNDSLSVLGSISPVSFRQIELQQRSCQRLQVNRPSRYGELGTRRGHIEKWVKKTKQRKNCRAFEGGEWFGSV